MTRNYTSIHFGQYLALLNTLYPTVDGLIAFDRSGKQIWQQCPVPPDEEQIPALIAQLLSSKEDSHTHDLKCGHFAELVKLSDPQGAPALLLCLLSSQGDPAAIPRLTGQPAFTQLSAMLLADYCQNIELCRRQEELDLIYKAEDEAVNTCHGRELLRQLVQNTSRFLNVDVSYLYIVNQNISVHRYRNDQEVLHADLLFDCMRDTIYPLLQKQARPLLVNDAKARRKLGIKQEVPFKFLV